MPEVALTQGLVAFVDEADLPLIAGYSWSAMRIRNTWYACAYQRGSHGSNGRKNILMHRLLLDAPKGVQVDHRNGDGLDNRRSNLRLASASQNQMNRHVSAGRSRFKGVTWDGRGERWVVRTQMDGEARHVGYFADELEAARAYDLAALDRFGEFAQLNFPREAVPA